MSEQLAQWTGEFGRKYADRNRVDWRTRVDTLRRIIPGDVRNVLEIGPNSGHNLLALESLGLTVYGSEPAEYARDQARSRQLTVDEHSVYDQPDYRKRWPLDLVMTSGVLIHVPPEMLEKALTTIYEVARKYILAIEYHADVDMVVEYRGHDDMLWKRDYGKHYRRLFPDLRLVGSGDDIPGFDRARYWLLAK